VTQTAYNHYSLLRSVEDLFGLSHIGFAAQAGLASFGSDVFTSSESTTTTTTSTTTSTSTSSPRCVAHASGAILGSVSVIKSGGHRALTFVPRRSGELSFQIKPARGALHNLKRRALHACARVTLTLPAGAGHIRLSATAGHSHQSETKAY
jgi:hypothetical protein